MQEVKPPESSSHSNVAPASFELKVKLGAALFEGSGGLVSMVVFGFVLSIVTVRLAESRVLPALSLARARTW